MGLISEICKCFEDNLKKKNEERMKQQAIQYQKEVSSIQKCNEGKVSHYVYKAVHMLPDYLNINVNCPIIRCKRRDNTNTYEVCIAKKNDSQVSRGRLIEITDLLNNSFETINFDAILEFETQYENIRLKIQELNNKYSNPSSNHFNDMIYYDTQYSRLYLEKNEYDSNNKYLLYNLFVVSPVDSENYITVNVVVTEPSSFPVL